MAGTCVSVVMGGGKDVSPYVVLFLAIIVQVLKSEGTQLLLALKVQLPLNVRP